MPEQHSQWQAAIAGELSPDAADAMLKIVTTLLEDDIGEVLRQLMSELILNLRTIRNLSQQVQEEGDPDTKARVLLVKPIDAGSQTVTVDEYTSTVLEQVLEARELANCLKYYAMALSERQPKA